MRAARPPYRELLEFDLYEHELMVVVVDHVVLYARQASIRLAHDQGAADVPSGVSSRSVPLVIGTTT
jgi:hypothetical protein